MKKLFNHFESIIDSKINTRAMEGSSFISKQKIKKEITKIENQPEKLAEIFKVLDEYLTA